MVPYELIIAQHKAEELTAPCRSHANSEFDFEYTVFLTLAQQDQPSSREPPQ